MTFLTSARLYLTPLSPIHVGCGEDFDPTNYVIEEGILYGFDPSRADLPDTLRTRLSQLGEGAKLLGIQGFFREQRQYFIPHAHVLMPVAAGLADDYERQIGRVANREANGNRVFNQLYIERASHTGNQPYIPGSSFKGALRTALLDKLNDGRPPAPEDKGKWPNTWDSAKIEKRLLAGDFENSPLRLLKAADLMPVGELDRQVLYAVNRKKDRVIDKQTGNERQPKGIAARKECIAAGQYRALFSTVVVHDLGGRGQVGAAPVQDVRTIARATHLYHAGRLRAELDMLDRRGMVSPAWKDAIEQLLSGELKPRFESGDAFLVRLGRYGGAECKTLSGEGVAQIKIMEGKGPDGKSKFTFQSSTKTVWLAAQTANDQKALIPFGWALVEINPQDESPQLKEWCQSESRQRPDMSDIRRVFALAQLEASRKKSEHDLELAELQGAEIARQAAEASRQANLAAMSPARRRIEDFREQCQARFAQLRGQKDRPNTSYQAKASELAKTALAGLDWTADEKAATADAIEEWLPRIVTIELKDLRKKLGLSALRD